MPYSVYHKQRYHILKNMVLLATCILFLLSFMNFSIGNKLLAPYEFVTALFGSFCLWRFKHLVTTKTIQTFSMIFTTMLLSLMVYAFVLQELHFSVYIWVLLIPLIAYNLTGVLYGFVFTAIFTMLSALVFAVKYHIDLQHLELKPLFSIIICVVTTWLLTHLYERSNELSKEKLTQFASKDPLTGLYNRYALQEIFDKHKHTDLSLIVLDIDFFKRINDSHGHNTGDYVLITTGNTLAAMSPSDASVFRLGGEEFGILLPKYALETAAAFAHNVVLALRDNKIRYQDKIIHITASVGVASTDNLPTNNQQNQLSQLMQVADNRLYQAKAAGRDRVIAS